MLLSSSNSAGWMQYGLPIVCPGKCSSGVVVLLGFENLEDVSSLFTILVFSCCIFSFFLAASATSSDLLFSFPNRLCFEVLEDVLSLFAIL